MTPHADGALTLDIAGPTATLTLNRPAARNALNLAMWKALPDCVAAVRAEKAVRVLIICGAGGHFASGADIAEFPEVFADRAAAQSYARDLEAATEAIAGLDKPVIARIDGYCIGAGLAIALACDLRIAAAGARFAAPPARLGLIYSLTDTRRLVRLVGASAAKAMLFTGELQTADDALRLGLVTAVHPDEGVKAAAQETAAAIAALSRSSIRRTKAMIDLVEQGADAESDASRAWFVDAALSGDFAEGLRAFQERRRANFP